MKVRDIMRKKVVTAGPRDSVAKVLKLFSSKRISGVPVVDGGRVVGMVTEGDVIARLDTGKPRIHLASSPDFILLMASIKNSKKAGERARALGSLKVSDIMTGEVFTAGPDDLVTRVAGTMQEKGVNRVPVVDGRGRLVGIVARQDIVRALVKF